MTTAVVLIEAERDTMSSLGGALADLDGVAEAYSVTGEWDFVAIVRTREAVAHHLVQVLRLLDPHDRGEVPLARDRVGLGDAVDVGEVAAERRQRRALGLDEHDRVGHNSECVWVSPGARMTTSAAVDISTSDLNASASASIGGNVS